MGAGVCALALQRQGDLFAKFTHPADLAGGHANHEGVGFDVFVDYSPCAHKGVFTDGDATDDGAVGPERGAFFDESVAVFVFALNQGAGVVHVGEDHAGATEHAFFERDVVVHADVVLNFAPVADGDLVAHEHVLAEGHALAYFCAATHMDKVPDAGAFAYLGALVDDGAGVDGGILHILFSYRIFSEFINQHCTIPFRSYFIQMMFIMIDKITFVKWQIAE